VTILRVTQGGSYTCNIGWQVYVWYRVTVLRIKQVSVSRVTHGCNFMCKTGTVLFVWCLTADPPVPTV